MKNLHDYDNMYCTYKNNLTKERTVFGRTPCELSQETIHKLEKIKANSRAYAILGPNLWLEFMYECGRVDEEYYKKIRINYLGNLNRWKLSPTTVTLPYRGNNG